MKSGTFAAIVFVVSLLLGVLFLFTLVLVKNFVIVSIAGLVLVIVLSIFAEKIGKDN